MRSLFAEHWLFAGLLALGALVRVVAQVAFSPAFVFSDGPTYLGMVDAMSPSPDRPVGYGVVLRVLSWVTRDVAAVAVLQHVLGLVTAVVIYALLVRRGVRRGVAALATAPVLLDAMQLSLEHSALSDVLFDLVVVAAVAVLAWRPSPTVPVAAVAGLLLGLSVLVRVVGQPTVLAGVLFCLVAATTWRARLLTSAVLVAAFLVPLVPYAAWYHAENGSWALTQAGGRALYMRTTAFVDCDRLELPDYEVPLCPAEPLGERLDPTDYGWHRPNGSHGLTPPAGITPDQAMRDFARRAIAAQPAEYARVVGRDFVGSFAPVRDDFFEYDTAWKWRFGGWVDYEPTDYMRQAYAAHGGEQLTVAQPWANLLAAYGSVVYLWGPLMALLLVLALVGLVVPRRGARSLRPVVLLVGSIGVGLALAPDVTAQFTWRYQLPMVILVPVAAALAWTRLRTPPDDNRPAGADVAQGR